MDRLSRRVRAAATQIFEAYGFEVVEAYGMTVAEQLLLFAQAESIVAPHGAARRRPDEHAFRQYEMQEPRTP